VANNPRYNFSPFARIIQTFFILSFNAAGSTLVFLFAAFTIRVHVRVVVVVVVVVSFPALWRRCRALLSFYTTAPVQIARNGIPNRARTPVGTRRRMHSAGRGISSDRSCTRGPFQFGDYKGCCRNRHYANFIHSSQSYSPRNKPIMHVLRITHLHCACVMSIEAIYGRLA